MLFTSRLEPGPDLHSSRQETAKRLECRVDSARGPLSEPARAAKRLESARGLLFEPPRDRLLRDSSRLKSSPDLGSCTTLIITDYSLAIGSITVTNEVPLWASMWNRVVYRFGACSCSGQICHDTGAWRSDLPRK